MRASPNAGPSDDSETFVARFRSRPPILAADQHSSGQTSLDQKIFVHGYIHTTGTRLLPATWKFHENLGSYAPRRLSSYSG